jgi:hypothetical protein
LVFVGTHDEPQSISPPLQAQVLPVQVAPAGHACPHDPQLALSVARFAQPVEHIISLAMHPEAQLPPLHTCGDVQVRPHMPQLALFDGTHMLLQESWPAAADACARLTGRTRAAGLPARAAVLRVAARQVDALAVAARLTAGADGAPGVLGCRATAGDERQAETRRERRQESLTYVHGQDSFN